MSITVIEPPKQEPLSLNDVKAHARITVDTEDNLIEVFYIPAARRYIEAFTHRALCTQTVEWRLDSFCDWVLELPIAPIQSVSSIKFIDGAGAEQTLNSSLYQVDTKSTPSRIVPAYGQAWPLTRPQLNAVTITMVVGYGDGDAVDLQIRQAMLLIVAELDARRESAIAGAPIQEVPMSARHLLTPFVLHHF